MTIGTSLKDNMMMATTMVMMMMTSSIWVEIMIKSYR